MNQILWVRQPFHLARRLRGQNATRKNGDCAIAFLHLTEKRRTSAQSGKTYANFVTTGKSDRKTRLLRGRMALSTMLLQVQRVSRKGMFGVLAFECSCAQAFQFPSDNGKEDGSLKRSEPCEILNRKIDAVGRRSTVGFSSICLPYVYVVEVNKPAAFLWITGVYRSESASCRTHNRMHLMCAPDWVR
ncbi:hypothetical protein BCAR13_60113 [Paraburkholderia caribensis]|nr:hypothetical protein BCAR13_60113 [Paraburkholderia caribensis]